MAYCDASLLSLKAMKDFLPFSAHYMMQAVDLSEECVGQTRRPILYSLQIADPFLV